MRTTSFGRTIIIAAATSGLTLFGTAIANADTGTVHQDRAATIFQADDSVAPVTQFSAALNRSLRSGQRTGLDHSILSTAVGGTTNGPDQDRSTTTATRTTEKSIRLSSHRGAVATGHQANQVTQANHDLTATIRVGSANNIGLSDDGIDRKNSSSAIPFTRTPTAPTRTTAAPR